MVWVRCVITHKVDVGDLLPGTRFVAEIDVILHPIVGKDMLAARGEIQGKLAVATTDFQDAGFVR